MAAGCKNSRSSAASRINTPEPWHVCSARISHDELKRQKYSILFAKECGLSWRRRLAGDFFCFRRATKMPARRRRYNSVVFHFQLFRGGRGTAKASYVAYQVPNLSVGQCFSERTHSREAISVPDDPEQFRVGPLLHFRAGQAGNARIHGVANIRRGPPILSMAEGAVSVESHSAGIQAGWAAGRFRNGMLARAARNDPVFAHRGNASFPARRFGAGAQIELSGEEYAARKKEN
jgi:hypothetical protein